MSRLVKKKLVFAAEGTYNEEVVKDVMSAAKSEQLSGDPKSANVKTEAVHTVRNKPESVVVVEPAIKDDVPLVKPQVG